VDAHGGARDDQREDERQDEVSRRLAVAAAIAGALVGAPAAAADTPVVSAIVFTGAAGTAVARTVALSTLGACPAYAGPGALTLYPGGSTDTLPAGSTWTLAEILQCGLSIPPTDVSAVQVLRPDGAAQAPLTSAALTDPSDYADPAAPGALPVVSNDGGQAQNTYTRPWHGAGDENARDQVTDSGPVRLLVYEHTAPLAVRIATRTLRRGAHRERVALSATVRTAAGTTVPASALDWQWTASTGASARTPAPTVTIPQGTATVTLLVTDAAAGSGGTASVALSYKPVRSAKAHSGGGGHGTVHATSGLGSTPWHHHSATTGQRHRGTSGHTTNAGAATTSATGSSTTGSSTTGSSTTSQTTTTPARSTATTTTAAETSTTATPTTTSATTTAPRPTPHPHRAPHQLTPASGGTLVRGRLLADVVPLRAGQSPLTQPLVGPSSAALASPAPAARLTVPGAVLGGLAAFGLLALGGAREHRRRSPRLHR
jgi:hypothetical protein